MVWFAFGLGTLMTFLRVYDPVQILNADKLSHIAAANLIQLVTVVRSCSYVQMEEKL